jgi:phosphopantetheinyl transferase
MDPLRQQSVLERLPYAKRLEIERRDEAPRLASLLAIELVLQAASAVSERSFLPSDLRYLPGGKPVLRSGPRISISHSRRRVAVAVSRDLEIGLDVEDRVERTPQETERLLRWTATEAVLKAAGAGIRDARRVQITGDSRSASLDGTAYSLWQPALAEDVLCRLASPGPCAEIVVTEAVAAPPPPAA